MIITITKHCSCGYGWESRKDNPKSCPRCKTRLDTPSKINTPVLATTANLRPGAQKRAPTPLALGNLNLTEEDKDFIEKSAQKLKYVKKDEMDLRLAELKQYCDENGFASEIYQSVVQRVQELKIEYAKQLENRQ